MNLTSKLVLPAVTLALLSASATRAETYTFQQGIGGYAGAVDTGISQGAPATPLGAATSLSIDLGSSSGVRPSLMLLRFDQIFGSGADQVPLTYPVSQATLTLNVVDAGSGARVFDMLQTWDENITWDSSYGTPGFPEPGVGAATTPVTTVGADSNAQNVPLGTINLDVTASLLGQQNGSLLSYGWALLPWANAGLNGMDVSTSDAALLDLRPRLSITTVPEPATAQTLLLVGVSLCFAGKKWLARRKAGERQA